MLHIAYHNRKKGEQKEEKGSVSTNRKEAERSLVINIV